MGRRDGIALADRERNASQNDMELIGAARTGGSRLRAEVSGRFRIRGRVPEHVEPIAIADAR